MQTKWWQNEVVYQIYPRSFMDSNGDGVGDLKGIIQKLDYLQDLGIGVIWLSPVYKSPQDDNGYDISYYYAIHEEFGTLEDMETLIAEGKKRGIQIVMDLVANHSSDEHKWFLEAKKGKENPYYDYYVWRDGEKGTLPNALRSCFSEDAWEWCDEVGAYYLHLFSKRQPDLNWENEKMRQDIYKMINWWLDRGIGGFRLDVIDLVGKIPDEMVTANGPKLHEYIKEMSRETFQKYDVLTVGESWGATTENAQLYSNPDGSELSMIFQFEHIMLDQQPGREKWDLLDINLLDLKRVLSKWQIELKDKGWNSLFWNNHDLPRIVSRWGNDTTYRIESAKMFATLLHGMQGTPYIYQGEEIGMTNVRFDELKDYQDIESLNMYKDRIAKGYTHEEIMQSIYVKGRDNARTPMQWDTSQNAGFTTGTPWLKVNPNYLEVNVAQNKADPQSIFHYYQKLIALRKDSPYKELLHKGSYELLLADHPELFVYKRLLGAQELMVICNFYGKEQTIDLPIVGHEIICHNYDTLERHEGKLLLRPYEAMMLVK